MQCVRECRLTWTAKHTGTWKGTHRKSTRGGGGLMIISQPSQFIQIFSFVFKIKMTKECITRTKLQGEPKSLWV